MPDYKKMYLTLLSATEDVVNLLTLLPPPLSERKLRRKAAQRLIDAQQRAEEIYIDTCEDEE